MAPLSPSFLWAALLVMFAAYLLSGIGVIVGRVRRNRVQRLLTRLEETLARSTNPSASHGLASDVLARASPAVLHRLACESGASPRARAVVGAAWVARVGARRLRTVAMQRHGRWRRIAALRALALSGDAHAMPGLAQAMIDGRPEVKAAAVVLLGQIDDPAGAGILIDALRHHRFAASRVATALDALPLEVPDLVSPLLKERDAALRYWGALLVRRYPSLADLPRTMGNLTTDREPSVRKAAIDTISQLGFAECSGQLRTALHDAVTYVRAHAARALGSLGEVSSAPAIATLLADHEWIVRSAARQGLEAMGPDVEPVLVQSLAHHDRFARNSAAEVLQHLGLLEALVRMYARGGGPRPARMIQQLARAAGPRIWRRVVSGLDAAVRVRVGELVPPSLPDALVTERG